MEKTEEQLKKEMIKKVDKRKCKKLIAMCFNIKDCEVLGLDKMLEDWAEKKVKIYQLFGENLKISKDIDISKEEIKKLEESLKIDESALSSQFDEGFIKMQDEIRELSPVLYSAFDSYFRFNTLKSQMPDIKPDAMAGYDEKYFGKTKTMNFSTLMHKVFVSEEIDKIVSRYLQNINSNIKGHIYISIDPFDYLTMSLNKSGWSSCHNLHKDYNDVHVGEYSAGLFSYMCDDVSLVAYRTDGEKYKYSFNSRSFMEESKAWRQIIYLSKNNSYFLASRQYPFTSEILAKITREMLENVICKETREVAENDESTEQNKWKVSRKYNENKKYVFDSIMDEDYDDDEECYDDRPYNLHYNDILNGRNYEFIYQSKYKKAELPSIVIGSNPCCPVCGENMLLQGDEPICRSCQNKYGMYI